MSRKGIPDKYVKILWSKSGGYCSICREYLIQKDNTGNSNHIGEMAHIEGEKPGAARYNEKMTEDERCGYDNLILLCPTCHTKIDIDERKYTVELLKLIKTEHEKWVFDSLQTKIVSVTFVELEIIIKYLIGIPSIQSGECFSIVPPEEKIRKNNLSNTVANLINIGLMQVKQVGEYINANLDLQFSERLRAGFVSQYMYLKLKGLKEDLLFYALFDFASNYSRDFIIRAAGLSVLVYYFELCEVFEK